MHRKWKSFRDSFRRELATKKKIKSGSAAQIGRKEYIYFQQLLFLLPVCETKPQEELTEDRSQENLEDDSAFTMHTSTPRSTSPKPKRKKIGSSSEEQRLFQSPVKNMEEKKASEKQADDDSDRHFLLSLLPHFKTLPEDVKMDVQVEFITVLQKYKRTTTTYTTNPPISHIPFNQAVTLSQYSHITHTKPVPTCSRVTNSHNLSTPTSGNNN